MFGSLDDPVYGVERGRHGIRDVCANVVGSDTISGAGSPGGLPTLPILGCFDQCVYGYAVLTRSVASGRRQVVFVAAITTKRCTVVQLTSRTEVRMR